MGETNFNETLCRLEEAVVSWDRWDREFDANAVGGELRDRAMDVIDASAEIETLRTQLAEAVEALEWDRALFHRLSLEHDPHAAECAANRVSAILARIKEKGA